MNISVKKSRKRESEKVVRRCISLPPDLDRLVGVVLAKMCFGSDFSGYVQAHLRKDAGINLQSLTINGNTNDH